MSVVTDSVRKNTCPTTGLDCISCDDGACQLRDRRKAEKALILDAWDRMDREKSRAIAEHRAEVERKARRRW